MTALVADLLRRAALAEGLDEASLGMVEPIARSLIGAGESLAVWWGEHPEEPVEKVAGLLMTFAWNGLGRLAVQAMLQRDYPVIQGFVVVFATSIVVPRLRPAWSTASSTAAWKCRW